MRSKIALMGLVLAACAKDSGKTDSATNAAPPADQITMSTMKMTETGGFKTPESVRYDADLDVYFVSNINGNPSAKDGNGYIAIIKADTTTSVSIFVEGGKKGVTLHAPKGIAIVGDTVWVADIDVLRGFNKRTGAKVADIPFTAEKATFLNDVAAASDGSVYVTDSGIMIDAKGTMSHPGVDRIFKVAGRTITEAATGDSLSQPNGITWDSAANRWLLASGGKSVMAWTEGSVPSALAAGPGGYDGIEPIGDGLVLVTSWADSAVYAFVPGKPEMKKVIAGVEAPADLGFDTKRRTIAVPRFNAGTVEFYMIH